MKKSALSVLLLAIACRVLAQSEAITPDVTSPNAERVRIGAERAAADSAFQIQQVACYQRFAVNRCLDDVGERRREIIADLRRQEIILNVQQRKARGAEQLQKLEDAQAQRQQDLSNQAVPEVSGSSVPVAPKQSKQVGRAAAQSREAANVQNRVVRQQESSSRASERARDALTKSDVARALEQRQAEAASRKARRQAELAKQQKPAAKPLPIPAP